MDFIQVGRDKGHKVSGWRRAARVNSGVLAATTITLFVCLIVAASRSGGGLSKSVLFYAGECDGGSAAQVNVALHLLLNVLSTAIFASSNFFMQVLNSPSREEVDEVHVSGSWMGIGVPSVRNAFRVSRFKTLCWTLLLVSSIPLHLLFNSIIFQTDQRDSDYQATFATEDFVNKGSFYPPGASLIPSGWASGTWGNGRSNINVTEYGDPASTAYRNISAVASAGSSWDNISATDCYNYYISCGGLKQHRNVILVVDHDDWVRDEDWDLLPNQTEFWNPIVPAKEPNSLWFSGDCYMSADFDEETGTTLCSDTCSEVYGQTYDSRVSRKTNADPWFVNFFNDWLYYVNHTGIGDSANSTDYVNSTYVFEDGFLYEAYNNLTRGASHGLGNFTINYCLAEPVDQVCHVGLSTTLLMAVSICVLVKTATAIVVTVVLGRRRQPPLVTLGDAVASFIERPDPTTVGMCTVGQRDIRQHFRASRRTVIAGPKRWLAKQYRRYKIVPLTVWWSSYLVFAGGVIILIYFFSSIVQWIGLTGEFLESDSNAFINDIPWTFTSAVLVANSPQLLLSFCYLAYNNLFTRLQMAKEWADYSSGYHPLRVTDPRGEQYATYRLQLPYKYSIPLIACSIFLHWSLSNVIYVFISQGEYFSDFNPSQGEDNSLPAGTSVSVGFSVWALLVMLIVSLVLILVPILLALKKLPLGSVSVGSNSIAISAACHVSYTSKVVDRDHSSSAHGRKSGSSSWSRLSSRLSLGPAPPAYSPLGRHETEARDKSSVTVNDEHLLRPYSGAMDDVEMRDLNSHSSRTSESSDADHWAKEEVYQQIARSKIRWGVIKMPPDFYTEFENQGRPYEHLSFGVQEDQVVTPVYMRQYA